MHRPACSREIPRYAAANHLGQRTAIYREGLKEFIRVTGMTHVRTSRNYPQSNGKLERWHKTLKSDAIRVKRIEDLEEARRVIEAFVEHYNSTRLHSAIGYIAPADCLAGRSKEIWAARDQKLEAAREQRRQRRQAARSEVTA